MGKRRRERIDFEAFDEENANGIVDERDSKDVIFLSDDWPRIRSQSRVLAFSRSYLRSRTNEDIVGR